MGGHTIFHVALLVAGIIILWFPEQTARNEDTVLVINLLRGVHAFDIVVAILRQLGSSPKLYAKHRFTLRMLDTMKLFAYIGSAMYTIFHESHAKPDNDPWIVHAEIWIFLEMVVFFGLIASSIFYLLGVQLKGLLGHNMDPLFERFKSDALEYYHDDITWFSFIFVMWMIHLYVLLKRLTLQDMGDADIKTFFSAYMLILRSTQLFFLMPFRTEKREVRVISRNTWAILAFFQLAGACIIFGFKKAKGIATGSGMIDSLVFIGQFALYKLQVKDTA